MPEQKFSDSISGAEVVVISWDMGMRAVDVAFGGDLLTQITDMELLRTGVFGAAPDGSRLIVRMTRSGTGDVFDVDHDGTPLVGGHVNFAASGPQVGEVAKAGVRRSTPRADGLGLDAHGRLVVDGHRVDDRDLSGVGAKSSKAADIRSGQTWLLVMAILNTVVVVLGAFLVFAVSRLASRVAKATPGGAVQVDSVRTTATAISVAAVVAIVLVVMSLAITVGWWVLWVMSKGTNAALAFGIARGLAAFYLALGCIQLFSAAQSGRLLQGLLGSAIGLAINVFAFKAFHGARRAVTGLS